MAIIDGKNLLTSVSGISTKPLVKKNVINKKSAKFSTKTKNGKLIVSIEDMDKKYNKTFYLKYSCIKTIEELSVSTGIGPSELIQVAIEHLKNSIEIE